MLDRRTFDERIELLQPLADSWSDQVVPALVDAETASCPYLPHYAWMYHYERSVKQRLEKALGRPLGRRREQLLFGCDGALSEGLSNAWVHGHARDRQKAIEVRGGASRRGVALAIVDRGPGFDFSWALERADRGGSDFFHHAGNGLRSLVANEEIGFGFSLGGRCLHFHLCVQSRLATAEVGR